MNNDLAKIFNSLSSDKRLKIIHSLAECGELCVCQLVELLQIRGATVSNHLTVLENSGLVKKRKAGRWVYYSLGFEGKEMQSLLKCLDQFFSNENYSVNSPEKISFIKNSDPEEICRKQRSEEFFSG
ncbi:MAG: ArsR/SmtB family transcription factor [Desulfobacteraceae bacterium]|jgi:ArsR family transcriptional regulator